MEQEVLEMLEKGASYPKSITHTGAIAEQPFLVENYHSLRAFQNGRSALSEIPSRTGRFAMQVRSQGGIFFSSAQYWKGVLIGGKWSKEEKHFLVLKFAILIFKKNLSHLTIHVQVDNEVALEYLLKIGGTRNPQHLKFSKSI